VLIRDDDKAGTVSVVIMGFDTHMISGAVPALLPETP
jgi:hypothetical protein